MVHGVEPSRLSEEGKGEGQPMTSNDTGTGREKKRCIDFVLSKKRLSNITHYGFFCTLLSV
jgi:outer membrane protein OmpA-like peptidoglycan-associated protein